MINLFDNFPKTLEEDLVNDGVAQNWFDIVPKPNTVLDRGLALVDLDGTIRETASGEKFINKPEDQKLIININNVLRRLNEKHFSIYGVSNRGGIKAGHKSLKDTIKEMRYTLSLTPYLNRIYFSVDDENVWVVTRSHPWLDSLPLWCNTFSRYIIRTDDMGCDPAYLLGGYRKPNPGMLLMAIADWCNEYRLLDRHFAYRWFQRFTLNFNAYTAIRDPNFFSKYISDRSIFMTGDRSEDEQAAFYAGIPFINALDFRVGTVPIES